MDELSLRRHVVQSESALGWARVFRDPAGIGAEARRPRASRDAGLWPARARCVGTAKHPLPACPFLCRLWAVIPAGGGSDIHITSQREQESRHPRSLSRGHPELVCWALDGENLTQSWFRGGRTQLTRLLSFVICSASFHVLLVVWSIHPLSSSSRESSFRHCWPLDQWTREGRESCVWSPEKPGCGCSQQRVNR